MVKWSHERKRQAAVVDDDWIPHEELSQQWAKIHDNVVIDFIKWCNNPNFAVNSISPEKAIFKAGQQAALEYFLSKIEQGRKPDNDKRKNPNR